MKFLNYKNQRSAFPMIVGFWLQFVFLTTPNLAKADISSVTLLSFCSKLQINLGILKPDLHIHATYHSPPLLDDIARYLDNLEQLTSSPEFTRDVTQGKILYRAHRGARGLIKDSAKTIVPYNQFLKPNKQEAIDLFCHATTKNRSCVINNVAEIDIACATAFIDVQVNHCRQKYAQNRLKLLACTVNDAMSFSVGDSSHHRNTEILMNAFNAYLVDKINPLDWDLK